LGNPGWRLGNQRLGDPPQLTSDHAEADQDQAPNDSGRTGTNESVSEAEFVDRNTKSDHHQPRKKGKGANAIQQSRHTLLILS
jgi:hypothetical protein